MNMETKTDQPVMEDAGDETRSVRPGSTEEVARDLEKRKGTPGKPADLDLRIALQRYRAFFDRLLSV